MKTCIALRHVPFEDLGTLAPILDRQGFEIRYVEAGTDELETPAIEQADLLVVLGGPIGVYEEGAYPFLTAELRLIARRLERARPLLGICLGAQLIAKALGARVGPGPAKEIGWAPVELTDAGRASPLRHIEGMSVLHWHGDSFDLPSGCEKLASTTACPCQAFRNGPGALGLQFHIEAVPQRIEFWLIGHAVELAKADIDPRSIRKATASLGRALIPASENVFDEWLRGLKRQ